VEQPNAQCVIESAYEEGPFRKYPPWWDVKILDDPGLVTLRCVGDWTSAQIVFSPKLRRIYYLDDAL